MTTKKSAKVEKKTPQGAEVATAPKWESELVWASLDRVSVCPLNPRKRVSGIEEMARSILAQGIIQPPTARPVPSDDGGPRYEVVVGQRRLLGLMEARTIARNEGLTEPPWKIRLLVREMDDRTAREVAWIENLHREDVSPREEAEGYAELLGLTDEGGRPVYTVRSLAAALERTKSYISRRLRLRMVPEILWRALEEGKVGVRQLEDVGVLPTEEARRALAQDILHPPYRVEPPMTKRETVRWIAEHYMASLRGVEWNLADSDLVPVVADKQGGRISGGACADCPHRSGNIEGLEIVDRGSRTRGWDANSCLLPACWRTKRNAYWQREREKVEQSGVQVLPDEEAAKLWREFGGLKRSCGLVDLGATPGYAETGHYAAEDTLPTWAELIGGRLPNEEVVLARDPDGEIHRLMPRGRAIELAEVSLRERGEESPFANAPGAAAMPLEEDPEPEEAPLPIAEERRPKQRDSAPHGGIDLHEDAREVSRRAFASALEWTWEREEPMGQLTRAEILVAVARTGVNMWGAADFLSCMGIPYPEGYDEVQLADFCDESIRKMAEKADPWWLLGSILLATEGPTLFLAKRAGDTEVEIPGEARWLEVAGAPLGAILETARAEVAAGREKGGAGK